MKHTSELTREGIKHTFVTNKNQTLIFNVEHKAVTTDTYTRVWCWRNRNAYKEILAKIL